MRELEFRVFDKILNCYSNNTMNFYHNESGIVSPETGDRYVFEQYINRKDEKDQKIFENDIVINHELNLIGVVGYGENIAGYVAWPKNRHKGCFLLTDEHIEKIGNGNQNPELL